MKKLFITVSIIYVYSHVSGQGNVGIGTSTPLRKLHVEGSTYIKDSLGIGVSNPHAPLQLSNLLGNRRVVLYESANNDHQFFGLGINGNTFRYQVSTTAADHVFFAAIASHSSNELMRIKGNGNVGIGINNNPVNKLDIQGGGFRTGTHATGRPLYVTGIGLGNSFGAEFRHDNGTEGIGIGYNTIYAAGSNTDQSLGMQAKGATGHLLLSTNGNERMRVTGSGSVGIGTNAPSNSAILELNSINKGLLIPRMSTSNRDLITSPANGLMILNMDDQCIDIYDGTNWIKNCGLKITGTNITQDNWTSIASIPSGREGAISFSIGTKGYMGTGYNGDYLNDFWEYNPATNIWTQKANASSIGRAEAVGMSITGTNGEKGYMGTGVDEANEFFDWYEYNPANNTWTQKESIPEGRREAVCFAIDPYGYVGTGIKWGDPSKDFWKYNVNTDSWTAVANDFPYYTHGATAFSANGIGYAGTGSLLQSPGITNDFYSFDPTTQVWQPIADFPGIGTGRFNAIGFNINGQGFVGLGTKEGGIQTNDLWRYTSSGWSQQSNFAGGNRYSATAFTIDGQAYIGSGYGDGFMNDFYKYIPSDTSDIYSAPDLPEPLYSFDDGIWVKNKENVYPSDQSTSKVGIGLTLPKNKMDIHSGPSRTGTLHPINRSLYVTGDFASDSNGVEFRHWNGTQGIGFGFNTIYATGSNVSQSLGLKAKGSTGNLLFTTNNLERMRILGNGNVGIGIIAPTATLAIARGTGFDGSLQILGTSYPSHFNYAVAEHTYIRGGKAGSHVLINDIAALGNVGIGTDNPIQKLHVNGTAYITGNTGIGIPTANAPLQFSQDLVNRKIVLWEAANNNNQFFGFGINGNTLRYQVNSPADHVFFAGTDANTSVELMRIKSTGNVAVTGVIESEAFIAPTLLNNFSNYGSGFATVAYYKDKMGIVHLRGTVNQPGNPSNLAIFTLPAGYRPSTSGRLRFSSPNGTFIGSIDVLADGNVVVFSGVSGQFSLDQITFRAD